jgi:hypothetical protein
MIGGATIGLPMLIGDRAGVDLSSTVFRPLPVRAEILPVWH